MPGGVEFSGEWDAMARANLELRTATRVLLRLGAFHARALGELERRAGLLPWNQYLVAGSPVRLRVTSRKSRLYHQGAIAERVSNAIAAVTGERPTAGGSDEDDAVQAGQLVVVRLLRDECAVSLDSSGEPLHRRGYRQAIAKAPMRETLAAALLIASEWNPAQPLIDPMAGSGTIPIEAALMARRMAPGLNRHFGFERWPGHDPTRWAAMSSQARDRILPVAPAPIFGSDRDAGAVEAAIANAGRAAVAADLTLRRTSVSGLVSPGAAGAVVTNPPYGARLGDRKRLRDLYAQLGNVLRARCPDWSVTLLVASGGLEKQLGIRFKPVFETRNGGLAVRAVRGTLPR